MNFWWGRCPLYASSPTSVPFLSTDTNNKCFDFCYASFTGRILKLQSPESSDLVRHRLVHSGVTRIGKVDCLVKKHTGWFALRMRQTMWSVIRSLGPLWWCFRTRPLCYTCAHYARKKRNPYIVIQASRAFNAVPYDLLITFRITSSRLECLIIMDRLDSK